MPGFVTHVGFNDLFPYYSLTTSYPGMPNLAFDRANGCYANTMRFTVDWGAVQTASGVPPTAANFDPHYANVRAQAYRTGFKVLPEIVGTPSWAGPTSNGYGGTYPAQWYISNDFGRFVVETVKYFAAYGVIDAVEIWNEPNLHSPAYVPTAQYDSMLGQALSAVNSASTGPNPTIPAVRVLGGALATAGLIDNWQTYFHAFDDQCFSYDLSLHAYPQNLSSPQAASDSVTNVVTQAIFMSKSTYVANIWLTETGPASAPNGTPTPGFQEDTLTKICAWLSGQSQLRSMIVHRLIDWNQAPAGHDSAGFVSMNVLDNTTWAEKPVCSTLRGIWP